MNAPIDGSYDVLTDPFNDPVSYDQTTLTHTVYSEDFGLIGPPRSYTLSAYMTQ